MFDRNERKIGLGWTEDGERVVAYLAVKTGEGMSQSVEHEEVPKPDCVSVSFEVIGSGPARYRSESFGQVPAEDRVIARSHENDADRETREFIETLWTGFHLNDMNAACAHMSADMLKRHEGESTQDWQTRMLDTVVCPVSGYKWGRAWLTREVPAPILAQARKIVASGRI